MFRLDGGLSRTAGTGPSRSWALAGSGKACDDELSPNPSQPTKEIEDIQMKEKKREEPIDMKRSQVSPF